MLATQIEDQDHCNILMTHMTIHHKVKALYVEGYEKEHIDAATDIIEMGKNFNVA